MWQYQSSCVSHAPSADSSTFRSSLVISCFFLSQTLKNIKILNYCWLMHFKNKVSYLWLGWLKAVSSELTLELLSGEFVGSLGYFASPLQWIIYNPVCCKASWARAGIRLWPATEPMDHHKFPLIECKLEKNTICVSIHHENKACTTNTHTARACPFSKYASLISCVCVHVLAWLAGKEQQFMAYIVANTFAL